jgi:hypothetical protein
MIEFISSTTSVGNLEERLAKRRAVEARGGGRHGASLVLAYGRCVIKPLLRAALHTTGLYEQGVRNALKVQVRHERLVFPHLPAALDGFRLLHISDLHIDGVDGLAEALGAILPRLSVDLCVLTGDYRFAIEGRCDLVYPRMRSVLGAVRSRLGVAGILGNHDCADMVHEFERLGVRMLLNESMQAARGLWVTGADEATGGGEFRQALTGVPPGAFHVALVHTPELYREAAEAGVALYLCGHTHGGQVCLPGGRVPLVNARCPRAYGRGLWKHGTTVGFTTSGAGCCMLPVRYNCAPEIAVFELARGGDFDSAS